MADNFSSSDSSVNDGVVPYLSDTDSDDYMPVGFETPPDSPPPVVVGTPPDSPPGIVDPYIDPHNINALPHVLEGWRRDMLWPRYAPQPFNPNDYPLTREPPHHTTPVLVARLRDVETSVENLENAVDELASHQSVINLRAQVRVLRDNFVGFTESFNYNAQMMETQVKDHNTLVDELNTNHAINKRHMKSLENRLEVLEGLAKKPSDQASSSRPKRARSS